MNWITDPQIWIGLLTLTVLEIVLGIDNIVFISILSGKLPANQQGKARQLGLSLALITRILLLLSISWVLSLKKPLLEIGTYQPSGRDLILLAGGLFLIWKSVHEIHEKLEGEEHAEAGAAPKAISFNGVIVQILLLDIVFSLDSVITAVGMA
jgi:predicted tellurium resistance membrane protein TerC